MSGECAHLPPHGHVIDRLKRRVCGLKQHSQDCQSRLVASHAARLDADRTNTASLLQKAQEAKQKKSGKYNKTDQLRTKSTDQVNDMRNGSFKQLKRKLENNNGICNNGELVKPGNVYNGSAMPPGGGMQGYMAPTNYGFESNADNMKKMKMDSEIPFHVGNQNTQISPEKSNGCTNGVSSSVSVQIVQKINNEPQSSIETTINLNTNIESQSGLVTAATDSQSVSVNVASRDIKQETTNIAERLSNPGNLQCSERQSENVDQQSDEISEGLNEEFLDDFLTNLEKDLYKDSTARNQAQLNLTEQEPELANAESSREGYFQCKTEKIDNSNIACRLNQNSNTSATGQYFATNNNGQQQQPRVFEQQTTQSFQFNGENQLSPYNHANQRNVQSSVNIPPHHGATAANTNITSPFLHSLNVSVNSTFNIMNEKTQHLEQHSSPQQQPQMGQRNLNRTTPKSLNNLRRTPEVPPRLHPPTDQGVLKGVSQSPISYPVPHQANPPPNFNMSSNQPTLQPQQNFNSVHRGMLQQNTTRNQIPNRAHVTGTVSSPGFSPLHTNGMTQRNVTSGMNMMHTGSQDMSEAKVCGMQLKNMVEKRASAGVSGHWNSNASASMNMAASMTFDRQHVSQHHHLSNEIQAYQSSSTDILRQQPQANVQSSNFSAASATAREIIALSQRQLQNGAYGNRLSHYPIENGYSGNLPHSPMTTKAMYGNCGVPNQNQMQGLKNRMTSGAPEPQMMRPFVPSGSNLSMSVGMGRQMDPYYPVGTSVPSMANGAAANLRFNSSQSSSMSVNQRMGGAHHQQMMMSEQFKMKSALHQSTVVHQRCPSPLSRQSSYPRTQQQMSMQNPSSSMIPGSTNTGSLQGIGRNRPGVALSAINAHHGGTVQYWNRNVPSQATGSNCATMHDYGMNVNSNPMSGNMGGYPSTCALPQRGNMINAPAIASAQGNNLSLSQGQAPGGMMAASRMQLNNSGGFSQPQRLFSASGMMSSGSVSLGQNDVLSGLEVFNQPNSPSLELNLISDLLDGK